MKVLHRGFAADLEIRSGGDGRTVCGICVPYNQPTTVNDWGIRYDEQFAPGAFTRSIANGGPQRVKFLAQHDRDAFPLGRADVLVDDPAKYPGLYGEFRVSKTERGDEALELIRDGALDGLSVGFAPVRSDPDRESPGALVTRHEARLNEVSAVSFPAYDGARIAAVRSEYVDQVMQALREADPRALADVLRAQMSTAEINDLPDDEFAYIEPGGEKDAEGRTTPRSLRHFPIHDAAHVRNALARAADSPFGKEAMPKILAAAKKFGITVGDDRADDTDALIRVDHDSRRLRLARWQHIA